MRFYYDNGKQCVINFEIIESPESAKKREYEDFQRMMESTREEIRRREKQRIPVDKNIAKSIVCDGAKLYCPKAEIKIFAPEDVVETITTPPEDLPMIELIVPEEHHVFLMKKDPVATTRDIEPDNFNPAPGIYCSYDHEKCNIKEANKYWEKVAKTEVNGYELLLKQSQLICTHCPGAKLKFVSNGQDIHIANSGIEKFFSPTIRKTIKIGGGALAIIGTLATPIPGDEEAAAGLTLEGTIQFLKYKGWGMFGGTRTIVNEITGYDILKNPIKSAIGEDTGEVVRNTIDFVDTAHSLYKLPEEVGELADNIGKGNQIATEITKNEEFIQNIKNNPLSKKRTYSKKSIKVKDELKFTSKLEINVLEKTNRSLQKNIKNVTPYIHSGTLGVSNTIISTHNYAADSFYLQSIEERYYEDIKEYSKVPFISIKQEYPQD